MAFSYLLISFLLGLTVVNAVEKSSPVFMWSSERPMVDLPDVSSEDSFSASNLFDHYVSPVLAKGKENAVAFLQDGLSVDHFTKYADVYSIDSHGGAFKNVKRLMEDNFSLEIPQVDSPHLAVEKLMKNFNGKVYKVDSLSQVKGLNLGSGKQFLLIVNLSPVLGAGDEEKAITENDALMGDVTSHLNSKGIKYSALFTGKSGEQNSESMDESALSEHSSRHLLAADSGCHYMSTNTSGIYVFLCGFTVCLKEGTDTCAVSLNASISDSDASASVKTNSTGMVTLDYKDLKSSNKSSYDVKVDIQVVKQQDRWVILRQSVTITGSGLDIKNATVVNRDLDPVIPRLFSFHCSQLNLYLETVKDTTYKKYAGTYVTMDKFQFQVFDTKNNQFFYAQDCVGFFTSGIWMGILTGLLLVFIMVYGTMMVLNLSVMDKFDDPKGKTITVNVSE